MVTQILALRPDLATNSALEARQIFILVVSPAASDSFDLQLLLLQRRKA